MKNKKNKKKKLRLPRVPLPRQTEQVVSAKKGLGARFNRAASKQNLRKELLEEF